VAEYYQEINTHIDIRFMTSIQDNLGKPASERSNQSGFNEARDDGVAVASGWILFLTPSQQCQNTKYIYTSKESRISQSLLSAMTLLVTWSVNWLEFNVPFQHKHQNKP